MSNFNCEDNTTYIPGEQKITPTGTIEITENGIFDVAQYASADVNVSGGASNVVVGDFVTRETSGTQDIDFEYSGGGFPLSVHIFPSEGVRNANNGIWDSAKSYGYFNLCFVKNTLDEPSYSDTSDKNMGMQIQTYKTSSSGNNIGSTQSTNVRMFGTAASPTFPFVIRSSSQMQIYVGGNSYGFIPNGHYAFVIVYSE